MHSSHITAIIVAILTIIGCVVSHEPLTLMLVGLALIVGLLLLWSEDGVPMLLMPFLLQWLSVGTKPVMAAILRVPIVAVSEFNGNLAAAANFASLALIALAIGMRLGKRHLDSDLLRMLQADVARWNARSIAIVALGMVAAGHFFTLAAYFVPGLTELLLALGNLVYCGLFLLVYWSLRTRKLIALVAIVVVIETMLGLTGFFATFRTTIFTVAIAAMCAQPRFRFGTILFGTLIAVPTLFLMVFWTSVKPDYRATMTNTTGSPMADQSIGTRLNFLVDRAQKFDGAQFTDGFEKLISRVSYIDFLSLTLDYVPANTPHENGARTYASIIHIFTPRIIFTSKPALESDTVVTTRYTGLLFGDYDLVSISLGYLGEAYVDWGWPGAIVFVLIFGAVIGRLVSIVLGYRSLSPIINAGLALMTTIPMWFFETALIKTVGGTIAAFITVMLLQRLILPNLLSRYAGTIGGAPRDPYAPHAQHG